jgi:hypothetical protein
MTRCVVQTGQLLGVLALWLFSACSASGPDNTEHLHEGKRWPALLAYYGDTTVVELPAAVRVGESATVRFFSFGGGCIRPDTTEAQVSGLSAEIRPYRLDLTGLPPNTACTSELRLDPHASQLRFEQPGRARVRILGLSRPGDHPFTIERELEITP